MWIAIVVFLLTLFFGFASIIIGGLRGRRDHKHECNKPEPIKFGLKVVGFGFM
jgi:hypothetical protein